MWELVGRDERLGVDGKEAGSECVLCVLPVCSAEWAGVNRDEWDWLKRKRMQELTE